ncbi:putative glycosyltransferase At5g20260 [Bidens hawaiensis]|uniref:putative glycosyltransferase At5g20260 n=1 Tax=Bidens hawaiensis TaxID=980011 RepID=UPI00404A545E
MEAATKFTVTFILRLTLLFLEIYASPSDQTQNLPSVSNLPLATTARQQQNELAPLKIKKNNKQVARIEAQLAKARGEIHKAIVQRSCASCKRNGCLASEGTIYRNPFAFYQSHNEMTKTFKVWTYKEGDIPLMHDGPMKSIYSSEGQFIEEMEREGNPIAANHPDEAHAFFIPISVANVIHYLYNRSAPPYNFLEKIQEIFEKYIGGVAEKYPYWNRSNGADHFFVSCHDWGPWASKGNIKLFKNVIRVLCNANSSEGFVPMRDVSMTEINGPYTGIPSVSSGQSPYNRSILAFFAGGNHGFVRNKLFKYWGNKEDSDIQVHTYLQKDQNYTELLSQSKYCLCPSGYEVASARATEAIYVSCIPVIIKDHYILPYSDVLDWSQFSVQVPLDKIPDLKRILQDISFTKYLEMQRRVMDVQRHFMVNLPAKETDVFHMILHSVWLRRLNVRVPCS